MSSSRWTLLLAVTLAGLAQAQVDPDLQKLLDTAAMKALGPSAPVGSGNDYTVTVKSVKVRLHKTSSGWVALYPLATNALPWLTGQLNAALTSPVLLVAASDGSAPVTELPVTVPAVDQTVSWKSGANLLTRFSAVNPGPLQQLQRDGLFPASGVVLTGTLGASVLTQLGAGTAPDSADWTVSLRANMGAWSPEGSPLKAAGSSLTITQNRTGVAPSADSVTFGMSLTDASLGWPGFSSPRLGVDLLLTVSSPADFALAGSLSGFKPTAKAFSVTSVGFSYASTSVLKGAGVKVQFTTAFNGGTQAWTAQAKAQSGSGLDFSGTLDSAWNTPFGLKGFTLLAGTSIAFGFAADGDVGFGVSGHLQASGVTYSATFCANVQVTPPALKAVGVSFDADTLDPSLEVQLASGLMSGVSSDLDARGLQRASEQLSQLPMPQLAGAHLEVFTPDLSACSIPGTGGAAVGGSLSGTASFLGTKVAKLDNGLKLGGSADDRFWAHSSLGSFSLANNLLSLENASLDVNAPLTPSTAAAASLKVTGTATLGTSRGALTVAFGASSAHFDFDSSLQALGTVKLHADSVGPLTALRDFTLSAEAQSNPQLNAAVTAELKRILQNAADAGKAANQAGYKQWKAAKDDFDTIDQKIGAQLRQLEATAASFVNSAGACLANKDVSACFKALQALSDFKATDDYGKWLLAGAKLAWADAAYFTQRTTYLVWNDISQGLGSGVTVSKVTVSGQLSRPGITVGVEANVLGNHVTPTFTLALASGTEFGTAGEGTQFADGVAAARSGNAPRPPSLWGKGAVTATLLTVDPTTLAFKAHVTSSATEKCPDGSLQQPQGTVYLYLRRPGTPPPDPKSPTYVATAPLNDRGGCDTDVVRFNDNASCMDGSGCCMQGGSSLAQLQGAWIATAIYAGGPMQCSGSTLNPSVNGFKESISNDVFILVGRSDDVGEVNPGEMPWGHWRATATCPEGTWASGFLQRVEPEQGPKKDDTALNSVKLVCTKPGGAAPSEVSSHDGFWGNWSPRVMCPAGQWLTQARLRNERSQGGNKDDTASNDTGFKCSGGAELKAANGTPWGTWTSYAACPGHAALCGISIKLEDKKGNGDDTAMNGMRLRCCSAP